MSRRALALLAALLAPAAQADEYVGAAPSAAELSRFVVVRTAEVSARLDTATGATWFLCARKAKAAWCRAKDVPSLPSGPAGRYRLVEGAPLLLLDSVSGRTWARCDLPTPEKGLAWCALEE